MTRHEEMKVVLENSTFKLSSGLRGVLLLFVAIGVVGFIVGVTGSHAHLAWQALLINTLFFSGIGFGALIFSVMWQVTDANWGRPYKRFAEALAAFTPVAFGLFLVLFFGAPHFFQWVDPEKVIHSKAGWLNFPLFVERNIALFGLTMVLAWFYIKNSVRPDIGLAKQLTNFSNGFADKLVKGYGSQEEEEQARHRKNTVVGPWLAGVWWLLATLLAFDWMMSIDQEWYSTMFGVQYMVTCLISGMCAINIISGIAWKKFKLDGYINTSRHHDSSKFIFALCLLWTYMCFAQVLVIWYGNIPEESPYVIMRIQSHEWSWLFWVLTAMMFIIPFFGLVSRTACNTPWFSRILALDILAGLWLEKYFLIVPSIQENMADDGYLGGHIPGFQYNLFDFSVTLGVLGAFLLCFFWFLSRVPALPISDHRFFKEGQH